MTEDEMLGWYHQLDGHEFEQAPGDGDGQGSLACQPKDRTHVSCVSCVGREILYHCYHLGLPTTL